MGETVGIINPDFLYFPEKLFQMPNVLSEEDCLLYLLPQPKTASYTGFDLSQIFQELSIKQRLGGKIFPGNVFDLGEKEYYISLKDNDFSERLGSSWKEFLCPTSKNSCNCGLSQNYMVPLKIRITHFYK